MFQSQIFSGSCFYKKYFTQKVKPFDMQWTMPSCMKQSHWILTGFSQDSYRILTGFSLDSHRILTGFSQDSHRILLDEMGSNVEQGVDSLLLGKKFSHSANNTRSFGKYFKENTTQDTSETVVL